MDRVEIRDLFFGLRFRGDCQVFAGYNLARSLAVRKDTANWIALTDYDIETARHMLETGRYLYVVFLCHLSLEKMLKAHVAEVTQSVPI